MNNNEMKAQAVKVVRDAYVMYMETKEEGYRTGAFDYATAYMNVGLMTQADYMNLKREVKALYK